MIGIQYSPIISKENIGKIKYIYVGARSFLIPFLFLSEIDDEKFKKQISSIIETISLLRSFGKDGIHILLRSNGNKEGQYLLLNGNTSMEFLKLISIEGEKPKRKICSVCTKRNKIILHHIIPRSALKKFAKIHQGVKQNFKGNLIPLCGECHKELEMLITLHAQADLEYLEIKKYDKNVKIIEQIYIADAIIILAKYIIGKIMKNLKKEKLLNELVEFEIEEIKAITKEIKNLKTNYL